MYFFSGSQHFLFEEQRSDGVTKNKQAVGIWGKTRFSQHTVILEMTRLKLQLFYDNTYMRKLQTFVNTSVFEIGTTLINSNYLSGVPALVTSSQAFVLNCDNWIERLSKNDGL